MEPPEQREANDASATVDLSRSDVQARKVRQFSLVGVEGAQSGFCWESTGRRCSMGSHPSNDIVLDDPAVSRFHCEILVDGTDAIVRDVGSRNGTFVESVSVREAYLGPGSLLRLGNTVLQFEVGETANVLPVSERTQFGSLVGVSLAMRRAFAMLENAASSDITVLLQGETGTGKECAAESLHEAGRRANKPFVVVDCGAIPSGLLASELFGHEKGAFTGAERIRVGAIEEASGGTLFLDEIGEMPPELQPQLLRVVERRQIRRVGGNAYKPVDVRIIAATNRDLRREVNLGHFRSDLYYRLAVVTIRLPPLRERPEDVPGLVHHLVGSLSADEAIATRLTDPEMIAKLQRAPWWGNVRELRNWLERCIVFDLAGAPTETAHTDASNDWADTLQRASMHLPYMEGRRRVMQTWEREYLRRLLEAHDGQVQEAARAAGIGRADLYRLLARHRERESAERAPDDPKPRS